MFKIRTIGMRLEESRGVRCCGKCRVSIHPGVLNLVHISLIWTQYALKYKSTGEAHLKKHYCLVCAKSFIEQGIVEARKNAFEYNRILKGKKKGPEHKLKQRAWEKVKNYENYLRIVKNWNKYFEQIIDNTHKGKTMDKIMSMLNESKGYLDTVDPDHIRDRLSSILEGK